MTSAEIVEAVRADAEHILSVLPPAETTHVIATADELADAIDDADDGAVLTLATTLVYPERLELPKPITLQSETYAANNTTRITRDEPAPTFMDGIEARVNDYALLGLALRGTGTIGVLGGLGGVWDRCRFLGDPQQGAHRGLEWNGGRSFVRRCFFDDIFRPDQDTQAICAWDCDAPGLYVDDCYLSAAGQAAMFGGWDSSAPERIPRAIRLTKSQCAKQTKWIGVQQVKCGIEFKCVIDATVDYCDLQGAGRSQGQGAYAVVATVRNQNGTAPWSCVTNVEIAHCTGGAQMSGVCNFLGTDDTVGKPSGRLDGFNLHDCDFASLDGWLGHGRVFMFAGSPAHVTLMNLRVAGVHMAAVGYFSDALAPTGFVAGGLALPSSEYGWFVDGGVPIYGGKSGVKNLQAYMPDAQFDATVV